MVEIFNFVVKGTTLFNTPIPRLIFKLMLLHGDIQ